MQKTHLPLTLPEQYWLVIQVVKPVTLSSCILELQLRSNMEELENITNEETMQQEETSAAIVEQSVTEHEIVEEPIAELEHIAEPEPAEQPEPKKYIIKIKTGGYLKSWSPFELCKYKADAGVFNEDWARGNAERLRAYKNLSCEVVEV